jgi:hypothetical protein
MTPRDLLPSISTAVSSRGPEYVKARDDLIALPQSVLAPQLEALSSGSWEEKLTSDILRGWLHERAVYLECMGFLRKDLPGLRPMTGYTPPIRGQAISQLQDVAPRVLELLWKTPEALSDQDASALFVALSLLRDRRAVEPSLLLLSESKSPIWRRGAILVLSAIAEPVGLPSILSAASLDQPDSTVRAAALSGLGAFDDPQSLQTLLDALKDRRRSVQERRLSAEALNRRKAPETRRAIADHLKNEEDTDIQIVLVFLLGRIGTSEQLPELERLAIASSQNLKPAIQNAISEIRRREKGSAQ